MIRCVVRNTLIVLTMLTAGLLLVRAQPYDGHTVRDLLLPEECIAPCFMGIRPGRTTVTAALDLLRQHEWVDTDSIDYRQGAYIDWRWNGQQPAVIDGNSPSRLIFNANATFIEQVWVGMNLQAGDVHLLFGAPSFFTVGVSQFRNSQAPLIVNEFYADHYFYTLTDTLCPLHFANYMRLPVVKLTFFNDRVLGGDLFNQSPHSNFNRNLVVNANHYRVC
ncbi:MAG: hypothetical protein R3E39_28685 [Anaerolineae bacterium]